MREIWDHPLGYSMLKIERADKHIAEIEERIRAAAHGYGPSEHIDLQTGEKYIYCSHADYRLGADLSLCVGDAIHNLHSALDIAWVEIIRKCASKGPSKWTRFPIDAEGTREKLESTLTKSAEIPRSHSVCDLMLDGIKPYNGGDADILLIDSLDINDKHRLLVPLITVKAVMGVELEHEDGSRLLTDIVLLRRQTYRLVIPMNTKLKNHGEAAFHVTFRKVAGLDTEVVPTLQRFSKKVLWIIRAFQRLGF